MFTRQLLIVFPDLILCPLSFPSSAFSFRLRDAAPIFAKPRQSPLLNIQPSQRCYFPFCSSLLHCFTRSRSPVSPYLSFPIVFSLKAQEQPLLSEEIQGPAKEFIEFVVQLIPWRQARVESWLCGGVKGWRREVWKGQENREGGLMWRAGNCIRGDWLKTTQQSLSWNRSCSNLLSLTYFPTLKLAKWGTRTIQLPLVCIHSSCSFRGDTHNDWRQSSV